jgi:hypothetical protein
VEKNEVKVLIDEVEGGVAGTTVAKCEVRVAKNEVDSDESSRKTFSTFLQKFRKCGIRGM